MTDLKFPKPPARIRDKKLLARFAATRPQCQVCHAKWRLQIHHMADLAHVSRRSDVFENLMRLCSGCHVVKFHSEARWIKQKLRQAKDRDELYYRNEYAELEMLYDGRVLWAT